MSEVVTGCIHIHTTDSDGTKSVEEIASIANEVNLDFIIVTDHMTLKAYQEGKEGYYGDTLVIIGYEIQDPDNKNHYLVFGLEEILKPGLRVNEYVPQAAEKGAIGIIAHPDEIRSHMPKYPSYPWTDWSVEGFSGIEIWNHMSEWMEGLKKYNQLKMLFSPRKFLKKPTDRILEIWDTLNQDKKIAGLGSIDVHGYPYKMGPFKVTIFPYKVQFQSIRTHLILDKPLSKIFKEARQQVYDAIRNCRIFISNYRWGDARGFDAEITSGNKVIGIGQEGEFEGDAEIHLMLPEFGDVRIIRNGLTHCQFRGKSGHFPLSEPGLYRVEVIHNGRGWIYSNHIRLV
ncbi:MAG: histidinol-phosphatase [candidate division Zixibacteria bacterium]|nr:histidinol-phosphatase [candidate division Zixibacteria bacterium]